MLGVWDTCFGIFTQILYPDLELFAKNEDPKGRHVPDWSDMEVSNPPSPGKMTKMLHLFCD